jgi:hypothetical protein
MKLRSVDVVARLLQDPRVRATVNVQNATGNTALHHNSIGDGPETATVKVKLLLQAGANPTIPNVYGQTPVEMGRRCYPTHHAANALLELAVTETEKASLLVKARRLAVAANSNVVQQQPRISKF